MLEEMGLVKATFGAGCFWGVQFYFDQIPGVIDSSVGFMGGNIPSPTYEQVCTENTGHAEVVQLSYDPELVTYDTLLKHFFRMHDPTQVDKQGPDVGSQYRSVIFYHNDDQKVLADIVIKELAGKYSKPIATVVEPAKDFYIAEEYHQKYTQKTGMGMCHIPYEPIQ